MARPLDTTDDRSGDPDEVVTLERALWSTTPRPAGPGRPHSGRIRWLLLVVAVAAPFVGLLRTGIGGASIGFAVVVGVGAIAAIWWVSAQRWRLVANVVIAAAAGGAIWSRFPGWYAWWWFAAVLAGGWVASGHDSFGRIASVARAAGALAIKVAFVPLSVLLVALPWLVNTIARLDPLNSARPPGTSWLAVRRRDPRPRHPWAADAVTLRPPRGPRLAASAIWIGLVVLVIAGVLTLGDEPTPPDVAAGGPPSDEIPAAFARDAWFPDYLADIAWLDNPATGWTPLQPHRFRDVATRYVNIVDGVRKTWHPPACDCRRLKVWVYGGSTTFGLGQRDLHTIASELARRAWEDGIALDVDNRGVVGDVHWQEANRYAWDVATYGEPDMVLFYDGINDTTATQSLVNRQVGDIYAPVDFQNDDLWKNILTDRPPEPVDPLPGAHLVDPPTTAPNNDPEAFAKLLMIRYDRSRKISADISAAHGVSTYYFWQPTRLSRPQVAGEPTDDEGASSGRVRDASISRHVPADVTNLVDVFDDNHEPLFYDLQHHNEVGARIVAAAMWQRVAAGARALHDAG